MPEAQPEEVLPPGSAPVTAEAVAPPAEEEIRIGDQTFKTQSEAFAYAQTQLAAKQHELDLAEAYRAGIADVSQANSAASPPSATPEPDDNQWETDFYANPKATLQKLRSEIEQEVRASVLGTVTQQTADQKLWAEFIARHPDLEGFDEDARTTLAKIENEVRALARTKGKDAALDFLAQKTRAKFQEYAARSAPTRKLPNGGGGPSPGTQTNVTPAPAERKNLSMVDQIRSLRKSRMG
jgi:hypothetical protein